MKLGRFLTVALAPLCLLMLAAVLLMPNPAAAASLIDAAAALPTDMWAKMLLGLAGTVTVAELMQKRGRLYDEMDTITRSELTDDSRKRFDEVEAEVKRLDADIVRLQRSEEIQRQRAREQQPQTLPGGGTGPVLEERNHALPAAAAAQRDYGLEFGAFVRCYADSQVQFRSGKVVQPAAIASEIYGERHPITGELQRAQNLSENAQGGFLVTPKLASEFLRLWGPNTIVRKRARVVPGNASYLKGKSGASVGYVGEAQQGNVTGVSFGMIDMNEKDIAAILPITRKLLRNANTISLEAYCRDELSRAAAEFEDRKCFYGTGVGKEIKGYAFSILDAMKFAAGAETNPSNQAIRAILRKVLKAMAAKNVPIDASAAWYMNPAIKMFLEDVYQGDVKAFPTLEGPNPTLFGYPVDTSTQITGPGGEGGDIFFGVHRYAMLGESVSMQLSVSEEASFVDETGKQVNMWAQGLIGIKLDMSHDFALQYPEAFGMISGVKWGQ
ncbi:phage major capsid protein [Pseudoroseomonas ludipueritiae]|uniref:Phage major capsid protein n=1 Tax=Pseudoroseomonas ludipueritiae TaxID=198093 RepID=A0ABR7RA42_9PROT|nr:phage major capsid protein [Pseudoroseomonas ludipueritiae]MBC9178563.1 phage major capsid protein [Pseudoroseomonas ludipueritiae]MCG7363199.1 phage major capsid protein [Roseomonas sp. ACRSG]